MIHAFLFVEDGNREREEHGPKFNSIMYNINELATTNITVSYLVILVTNINVKYTIW